MGRRSGTGEDVHLRHGIAGFRVGVAHWAWGIALWAGLLAFMGILLAGLLRNPDAPTVEVLKGLAGVGFLLLAPVLVYALHRTVRDTSLTISDDGIQCRPPRRSLLLAAPGGRPWNVGWGSIQRIELVAPLGRIRNQSNAHRYRLRVVASGGTRELAPSLWVRRDGADHRPGLFRYSHMFTWPRRQGNDSPEAAEDRAVRESPLVQALEARGFRIEDGGREARSRIEELLAGDSSPLRRYDLWAHPGLRVQLTVAGVAGLYALIDGLLLRPFRPLELIPWWLLLVLGLTAFVVVAASSRGVPFRERGAVGALCLAAVLAGSYPGMLRVNALTAEPVAVEFTQTAPGRFAPPAGHAHLPRVDLGFIEIDAYWDHVGETPHPFQLQRGAFGFWQLDMEAFYRHTGAFYGDRDADASELPGA